MAPSPALASVLLLAACGVTAHRRLHSESPIEFHAADGVVYAKGRPFLFKGLSWWGAEGPTGVVQGLEYNTIDFFFEFMSAEGFNTVRLPITLLSVLANPKLSDESLQSSPAIYNKHYVDAVGHAAARCGDDAAAARRGAHLARREAVPGERVPHMSM